MRSFENDNNNMTEHEFDKFDLYYKLDNFEIEL